MFYNISEQDIKAARARSSFGGGDGGGSSSRNWNRLGNLLIGAGIATVGWYLIPSEYTNKARRKFRGIFRFFRASATAVVIAGDYKIALWRAPEDKFERRRFLAPIHQRSADRLLNLCKANGGLYIKAGQLVAALDYIIPEEYLTTLRVLHDAAPFSSLESLEETFYHDTGKQFFDVFSAMGHEPIGAASLAQVHRAILRSTGESVAVKIQHPYVAETSEGDMDTIEALTKFVAWVLPQFSFVWLAEETRKNIPKELDFLQEGRNAERLKQLVGSKLPYLRIPKIYWELSSSRVLVMEYCEGGKVDDLEFMKRNGIDVNVVSSKLKRVFSEMMFTHGFVHCDPHPGNILVRRKDLAHPVPETVQVRSPASGGKNRMHSRAVVVPVPGSGRVVIPQAAADEVEIILLDHGLYQQLTDEFRMDYCHLWKSLIEANESDLEFYARRLGVGHMYQLFGCVVAARSWESIMKTKSLSTNLTDLERELIRDSVQDYFVEIADILNKVPRPLLLLFKTNDLLRSVDRTLHTTGGARSFAIMAETCLSAIFRNNWKTLPKQQYHSSSTPLTGAFFFVLETLRLTIKQSLIYCGFRAHEFFYWAFSFVDFRQALH